GKYRAVVTNQAGSATSALATLSLVPAGFSSLLAAALDASNLVWTTTAAQPWFAQTDVSGDGEDAAQSALIGHSQTTTLQTTITGPGTVAFWWKVSSEPSNDRLLFYIGSTEKARISGEIDWQWKTFTVSSGSQVLKWTYSKNSSRTGGLDRAYVDQVMFIPNNIPTAPIIAAPPLSASVEAGAQVTFNVGAIGSPTLRYQWQHNGTNLTNNSSVGVSGATSATLTLANVPLSRAGTYSVIVSNAVGAVTNSDAFLNVIPVLTLAEALDLPAAWTTSSSLGWTAQTNVTHDGTGAARSGAIPDDKSTSIQTVVTGPGVLNFWWKVSCQPDDDRLRFYINGSEQARISGEVGWTQRVYNLPSGTQTLQWKYSKDKEISLGQDSAWVDQVEFAPNATPSPLGPKSLTRLVPLTISVFDGKVLLSWTATPDKIYQVLSIEDFAKPEWTELAAELSFTDAGATFQESAPGSQRFYQIIEK
ncbi:MAG TPA: immunoglobulin domain-containing protein, partial [Verrucomicrobiae bacterium]